MQSQPQRPRVRPNAGNNSSPSPNLNSSPNFSENSLAPPNRSNGPRSPIGQHRPYQSGRFSNPGSPQLRTTSPPLDGRSQFGGKSMQTSVTSPTTSTSNSNENTYMINHVPDMYEDSGPEDDDWLHNVTWKTDKSGKKVARDVNRRAGCWRSCRGISNIFVLLFLGSAIALLFLGYPLLTYFLKRTHSKKGGFGLGGTNATGQIASFTDKLRVGLIDHDTPEDAYVVKSVYTGKKMNLVFSDEFETDGRSFWPGDDPYWEAENLYYWETGDYEWYSPNSITTKDGALVISLTARPEHNLNFRSGLLTTWNKVCFTGGRVEVAVVLPGDGKTAGYWPAAWLMGNLARAGYGASTHGTWPYVYDACDVGTLPNQTWPPDQGGGPPEALNTGWNDGPLSYLPGQRLSACTCPGEDHPGPWLEKEGRYRGRASPELDIFEVDVQKGEPRASMSLQAAPYDVAYRWNDADGGGYFNPDVAEKNSFRGGTYQQAFSGIGHLSPEIFENSDNRFGQMGVEWKPGDGPDSYATWSIDNREVVWRVNAKGLGPNSVTQISQRQVPQEPMYLLLNIGLSSSFSKPNWDQMRFPAHMKVDYVRVYQEEGLENVTCDPPDFPTQDYIKSHWEAYNNANLTTWTEPRGLRGGYGNTFPRNRLLKPCDS